MKKFGVSGRITLAAAVAITLVWAISLAVPAPVGDRARVAAIPGRGNCAVLRAGVSRLVKRGQLYRPSERGEVAFSLPLDRDYLRRVGEDQ